jgi:hypothetical protein
MWSSRRRRPTMMMTNKWRQYRHRADRSYGPVTCWNILIMTWTVVLVVMMMVKGKAVFREMPCFTWKIKLVVP